MRGSRLGAVAALGLCLGLTACFTVGRPFPVAGVQDIVVGETTRDQIRQKFGDPWRVGLENGKKTWTYGHYKYSVGSEAQTRDLIVRFHDDGRVASYAFNSTHPGDVN